jgi:hypothetical protein
MNPTPRRPRNQEPVSDTERIQLTIPLDRPEQPVQSKLSIVLPEPQPQLTGDLARDDGDDDDWK